MRVFLYILLILFCCPLIAVGQDELDYHDREEVVQKNVYENPQFEILSQNKKVVVVTFVWDENTKLEVEVVSIIGNVFFKKEISYKGVQGELSIEVNEFPTGIYLLKFSDKKGQVVVRKFTKY